MRDFADAVAEALTRRGTAIFVRLARVDHRGLQLAELCEMREGDRDWDAHFDGCPWRIIGVVGGGPR